jgi:hypothetical protein
MVDRKKELKKWFIDHPKITTTKLGRTYDCSKQAAWRYLFAAETAPAGFLDACRKAGIPEDLLPEPTRTKAELLAEVEALRAENAELKRECGCPA